MHVAAPSKAEAVARIRNALAHLSQDEAFEWVEIDLPEAANPWTAAAARSTHDPDIEEYLDAMRQHRQALDPAP